jgi:hypothetical protein
MGSSAMKRWSTVLRERQETNDLLRERRSLDLHAKVVGIRNKTDVEKKEEAPVEPVPNASRED